MDKEIIEKLEKVNRNNIPSKLVSKTKLKLLGVKVDEKEAVAWAYQQFTHLPYLLYDVEKYGYIVKGSHYIKIK